MDIILPLLKIVPMLREELHPLPPVGALVDAVGDEAALQTERKEKINKLKEKHSLDWGYFRSEAFYRAGENNLASNVFRVRSGSKESVFW